ncbi:H(+)/Cl(-) exchange transporter 7-like [Dendronephthya gigantea]|uniref:H(+)/Cl(-) exchange transporter 7-like n=1 Tax=Dendronephthya gigantea TaxID=151771 RepID=UPI00106ADF04|nr:H(+)/Cl(-) exchange transporter 7-like [Dendronephthya gigantea]XP_028413137.1 H(+)/Cl(-) exchange transporter 7-like [Dendronephthya gigantea]
MSRSYRMLKDMTSENSSLLRNSRDVAFMSGSMGSTSSTTKQRKVKPGRLQTVFSKYESLDYEVPENQLYVEEYKASTPKEHITTGLSRWVVMFLVGIMTALVAVFIDICIEELAKWKYNCLHDYLEKYISEDVKILIPFCLWIAIDIAMVGFAAVLVSYGEPVAAGSGIPVIKCFLNGVKIPHVVRLKTLVIKAVGVIFAVAGGLAVGKEGPMIHSGAVLAAGISQGRSILFRRDFKLFDRFRTDHEKRDFVSGGAAAGVSAAFGAPVGGVLFSLEEGASFWNQSLTWRIFFASVISTFSLNWLLSIYHGHSGELSYPGLINFGSFSDIQYSVYEMPFLLIMGLIGGLLGALFNFINQKLTVFRIRYIKSAWKRVLEAIVIAAITTCTMFNLIYYYDVCQPIGVNNISQPLQFFCKDGEYSLMGTLAFRTPEQSIKSLFHTTQATYTFQVLALFFPVYFLLATWTYGSFVPSGLFVPCILTGAAWGRLFAVGLSTFLPNTLVRDTCLYAVVGAAAFLGGVVRMTISLTVILMEATRNITYGLPMMLVIMVAKWIGDLFNEGLYDIHIRLSRAPILGWDPPQMVEGLNARNIMNKPVCCMNLVENVGRVIELLKTTTHNGFPVVDPLPENEMSEGTFGAFRGTILRSQLIVLLKHKVFFERGKEPAKHQLTMKDFRDAYPRFQPVRTIRVSPLERECCLDLQPFMNVMPYTVHEESSISRVFHLFRAIGLRHLIVVDHHNQVVGIVTRKDLARYRQWSHRGQTRLEKIHITDDSASSDDE